MAKIKRSRTGCFTCKQRRRKCDETKPSCLNCVNTGRECGYGIRLSFDVDDSRHSKFLTLSNGKLKYGFRGRPRLLDTLSKREAVDDEVISKLSLSSKPRYDQDMKEERKELEDITAIDKAGLELVMTNIERLVVVGPQQQDENSSGVGFLYKSLPMQATTTECLSGSTVFDNSDINLDTFSFIHQGLDYLLNGLQATEYFGRSNIMPSPAVTVRTTSTEVNNKGNNNNEEQTSIQVPLMPQIGNTPYSQKNGTRQPSPSFSAESFNVNFNNYRTDDNINNSSGGQEGNVIDTTEIQSFIDTTNLYPSAASLSYSDENLVLRHFFNRLLPLLDSHPNNPWPELALRYCDFEIARSCFLSLSCIHLYGSKGGHEYYRTGMIHMNSMMKYLIKYINNTGTIGENGTLNLERKSNDEMNDEMNDGINVDRIVGDLKEEAINQKRSTFFVILILIYVHILFAILESGKSVLSRIFFKLFSTIANDSIFKLVLENIDQSQTSICILSWYDTITAVESPDCRLPYCDPLWYGDKNSEISLAKMVGCPGEIFACIAKICQLRLDLKDKKMAENNNDEDNSESLQIRYDDIKFGLLNYRDYVVHRLNRNGLVKDDNVDLKPEDDYDVRLRGAQCWALSALVKLEATVRFSDSQTKIEMLINEFIMCYGSMDPECTTVVQMVWPVFNIGCECVTQRQRDSLQVFIDKLNLNGQTGVLKTMKKLVEQSWRTGESMSEILSGKEWLGSGTDFLPL